MPDSLVIKRMHGLGNVLMLLPFLRRMHEAGQEFTFITDSDYAGPLGEMEPDILHTVCPTEWHLARVNVDLDGLTADQKPTRHRAVEYAEALGLEARLFRPRLEVGWVRPGYDAKKTRVLLVPHAGHPARAWPASTTTALQEHYGSGCEVLVPDVGQDAVRRLFRRIAKAELVISADSGPLYVAGALGVPAVGLFGPVNPIYRLWADQIVIALQPKLPCCPCNKEETCRGKYACVGAIPPSAIIQAGDDMAARHHLRAVRQVMGGNA